MKALKTGIVLGILGLIVGYFIFAQHKGEYIPLDALFASGLEGKIYDFAGRGGMINKILASGVVGLLLGFLLGAASPGKKQEKEGQAAVEKTAAADAPKAATAGQDQVIIQLEKYAELKEKGILTQEEFEAKKTQLLNLK